MLRERRPTPTGIDTAGWLTRSPPTPRGGGNTQTTGKPKTALPGISDSRCGV